MFTKKNTIMFFAGAAAFHTLSHILLYFTDVLPMRLCSCCSFIFTPEMNFWAVIISAAVTVGLLYWASQLKK